MPGIQKPFAASCENNKEPLLVQLRKYFSRTKNVVEIGSGTGQHAVYFSTDLSHLSWQPTDREQNLPGIQCWVSEANLPNLRSPTILDVIRQPWPLPGCDGVFSANTAHIMSWSVVIQMFQGVGELLLPHGVFCLYGPFKYLGDYTSESNARFDVWLKSQDPLSGIRDFEAVNELALSAKLDLFDDVEMPANNRLLVWQKV